jgi:hypothetical protein
MELDVRTKCGSFQPRLIVGIITERALIDRTPAQSIADKAFSMLHQRVISHMKLLAQHGYRCLP